MFQASNLKKRIVDSSRNQASKPADIVEETPECVLKFFDKYYAQHPLSKSEENDETQEIVNTVN